MIQSPNHYKRYKWIRITLFGLLIALDAALLNYVITCPKCINDEIDLPKIINLLSASNYPNELPSFRKKYMKHLGNATYLDYTGAGVYNDLNLELFRREILYNRTQGVNESDPDQKFSISIYDNYKQKVISETRETLLNFLGTSTKEHKYTVIFVPSATQALKLIGENYKWTKNSKYIYTRYNHNSVLGIRKYALAEGATFSVVNESTEFEADPDALYALPLEENFAGMKISKKEMHRLTHTLGMNVIADTSAYLPTNRLNLTETPFSALVLSFYKIIGFPNYGACILRNDFIDKHFQKKSYMSNDADVSFLDSTIHRLKYREGSDYSSEFEDDEPNYEMCYAALIGLKSLMSIGLDNIEDHVHKLSQKLYQNLHQMKHSNDAPAIEIYGNHGNTNSLELQGGIVSFNIKKSNGDYIGYSQVVKDATKQNIHLRGGCHCNPGACFSSMKIPEDIAMDYFNKKTTCGDNNDIIDGIPLGAVRASLGWATVEDDINIFTKFILDNYVF